jgi:hypothetical protein
LFCVVNKYNVMCLLLLQWQFLYTHWWISGILNKLIWMWMKNNIRQFFRQITQNLNTWSNNDTCVRAVQLQVTDIPQNTLTVIIFTQNIVTTVFFSLPYLFLVCIHVSSIFWPSGINYPFIIFASDLRHNKCTTLHF